MTYNIPLFLSYKKMNRTCIARSAGLTNKKESKFRFSNASIPETVPRISKLTLLGGKRQTRSDFVRLACRALWVSRGFHSFLTAAATTLTS